jgi:hypothetical protein
MILALVKLHNIREKAHIIEHTKMSVHLNTTFHKSAGIIVRFISVTRENDGVHACRASFAFEIEINIDDEFRAGAAHIPRILLYYLCCHQQ